MIESHELVQEGLERLETGDSVEAALAGLPEAEARLVRLAARLRGLPQPVRSARMAAHRQRLLRAAREGKLMARGAVEERRAPARPRWVWPVAFGGFAAMFACALVVFVLSGAAIWLFGGSGDEDSFRARSNDSGVAAVAATLAPGTTPAPPATSEVVAEAPDPQRAVVREAQGVVEVQGADDSWHAVRAGQTIGAGQRLRTRALSSATLGFYDGSQAHLGPATEVSVDSLDARTAGARVIVLTQRQGETSHDVVASADPGSNYQVLTPSGSGTAKGTTFTVLVTPALFTYFSVDEGAVAVTHLDVTVLVVAGQITLIEAGQPPAEPVFRISGEGEVLAIGPTWDIAGQPFVTHPNTIVLGDPRVGDLVHVEGRMLLDGTRLADRIVLVSRRIANTFSFVGAVDSMGASEWVIAGQAVRVDEMTRIEDGITAGDLVEVEGGIAADGTLWAALIRHLAEEGLPFRFAGIVESIGETNWTVSGISVTVDADTHIADGLVVGDMVVVAGHIQEDDTWLAASIERLVEEGVDFEFTGTVESMDPWRVSGITLAISDTTEIDDGIEVGDRVRVEGLILSDGTWLASEIQRLDDQAGRRFEFVGLVMGIDPWVVSGVALTVDANTEIKGDISAGEMVKVEGWILEDGAWLATEIKHTGWHRGQFKGCWAVRSVVRRVDANQIVLLDFSTLALPEDVTVEGELKEASVVLYYVCFNPGGKATILYIIVIYQLDELPVIIIPTEPAPEGDKVTICHKPGGDASKAHTLVIGRAALETHLGHGDTLGPCP